MTVPDRVLAAPSRSDGLSAGMIVIAISLLSPVAQIRTVLASHHELFRLGLRYLLASIDTFDVIAEAKDGHEALELITREAPQLAIVDTGLPGISGIELLRQRGVEACRLLLLAGRDHCHLVHTAIEAGAAGFLPKTATAEEFTDACRAAARGNLYVGSTVGEASRSLLNGDRDLCLGKLLTRRERQVLQLLAEGVPTKQMAARLGVSARTIETHRYQIMSKLNERSIPGLTKLAIRHGLTTL